MNRPPQLDLEERGCEVIDGVFVGLATIDVIYNVAEFPAENTKVAARSQEIFVGGPATNAAIAFRGLGGRAALVAAVGRHAITNLVRAEFTGRSIHFIDLAPEFGGVPAISSVVVDDAGRRNVVSANAARIPVPSAQVDLEICKQAKVIMVDGHAMHACQAWAEAAKALGKPVILDGGSWKEGTEELLKAVHTVVCSADFRAPGCNSENETVAYLRDAGVEDIAITHGAEPICYFSKVRTGKVAVPQIDVKNTTGAGDIFHGAFCYFLAAGAAFEDALWRAAQIASLSCRYRGTREWLEHLPSHCAGPLI
jgi:Sugar kinases, ribokinase family